MSAPRQVLLCCLADWAGAARLPAAFSDAGFEVAVFAPAAHAIARSNRVATHLDAPADPAAFIDALRTTLQRHGARFAHCVVCDDPLLFELAALRSEPWVARLLPVAAQGPQLDFVVSKLNFPVVAAQSGLPVPPTRVHRDADALVAHAAQLGFPLVAKLARGYGGAQVFALPDMPALHALLRQLPAGTPLALQCFVPGNPGACCAVWVRGELKAWFAFLGVHTWPHAFSLSTVVRLVDRPALEGLLREVGRISGFHGLGGIDFIEQDGQRVWLTEQHGRPIPQFVLAAEAGIDLPRALRAVVDDDAGAPLQRPRLRDAAHPVYPLFPQEAWRMAASGYWSQLAQWRRAPRYRAQLPRGDRPLMLALTQQLRRQWREQAHHAQSAGGAGGAGGVRPRP